MDTNLRYLMLSSVLFCAVSCAQKQHVALDLTNFDTNVSLKDDFYHYAVGGWQKKNPLKPEFSSFGAFNVIDENNKERLNALFSDMAKDTYEQGSVNQKIADLYKMGLDSVRLNNEGGAPIAKYVEEIQKISSKDDIITVVAAMHSSNSGSPFFGAFVMEDLMDSDSQILYFGQSGLGIGDRDYYLDAEHAAIREGYVKFLEKIFTLSGLDDAAQRAEDAMAVETAMAKVFWTREQERDLQAMYNPMSTDEIAKKYPALDIPLYLKSRGIEPQAKAVACELSYFKGLDDIMKSTSVDKLKNYLLGMLITDACGAVSDDYYSASFDFFSAQMSGIKEQKPRWKRAMQVPNAILGEAVGKMYVEKYFPESSKQKMLDIVKNLQASLGQHIQNLDWMSDATKEKALDKLSAFTVKIGYPDKWKDYSTLSVNPADSYYENLRNAGAWYVADNLSKLGKPTDKTEWGMTPQTVNAYYNPTSNEICFPAAILQPPFFDPEADDAVNYGGIGVVISHEMTHGFDDQGRLFDKNGNMQDWWAPEDAENFKAKADILVKQFDAVEVLPATDSTPAVMANGTFTLGENIADNGGLNIAFTALKNSFNGQEPAPIDGLTAEQRFFLSYALVWASNITDEEKGVRTKTDPHSLAQNRVNVSLRNITPFFEAFGIGEGDAMFRPESERVNIW